MKKKRRTYGVHARRVPQTAPEIIGTVDSDIVVKVAKKALLEAMANGARGAKVRKLTARLEIAKKIKAPIAVVAVKPILVSPELAVKETPTVRGIKIQVTKEMVETGKKIGLADLAKRRFLSGRPMKPLIDVLDLKPLVENVPIADIVSGGWTPVDVGGDFGDMGGGNCVLCSIGTGGARRGMSRIGRRTSFGRHVAAEGKKLNTKKAKKSVEPVFGDLNVSSGGDFYNEIIARAYVFFGTCKPSDVELVPEKLHIHSEGAKNDVSFTFKSFDRYTFLLGLLSLHVSKQESWDYPEDADKALILSTFLKRNYPTCVEEIDKLEMEVKQMEDETVSDEDDEKVRIEVDPDYAMPEGLDPKGLVDRFMDEDDLGYIYNLEQLMFSDILPHIYFPERTKNKTRWSWPIVRAAMMECRLFQNFESLQMPYLPKGATFARTMFAIMCNHDHIEYDPKMESAEFTICEQKKTIRMKTITDMTNKAELPKKDNEATPYAVVRQVVKSLKGKYLDFSNGESLLDANR